MFTEPQGELEHLEHLEHLTSNILSKCFHLFVTLSRRQLTERAIFSYLCSSWVVSNVLFPFHTNHTNASWPHLDHLAILFLRFLQFHKTNWLFLSKVFLNLHLCCSISLWPYDWVFSDCSHNQRFELFVWSVEQSRPSQNCKEIWNKLKKLLLQPKMTCEIKVPISATVAKEKVANKGIGSNGPINVQVYFSWKQCKAWVDQKREFTLTGENKLVSHYVWLGKLDW